MIEMRPEWWKAEEMGTLQGFVEGWCQSILHPSGLEEDSTATAVVHVCRRCYPKRSRDGGELGFVKPRQEFPDISIELMYVSNSGGNFTHSLCVVECGLVELIGCICSLLEKLMGV